MSEIANHWPWILGRESGPEEVELSAGPLTATLSGLDLLDVRIDGVEVIRRLCMRVRDTKWGTIEATAPDIVVERNTEGFAIAMRARHIGPAIDFSWTGRLAAGADGSLSFTIEGSANADCTYSRIGLIVLHPLSGASHVTAGSGEDNVTLTWPDLVAPVVVEEGVEIPLIPAFDRLSVRYSDSLMARFIFAGDLFETEDQRNWGDGSFKTFSTPLSVPIPLKLARGGSLRQSLDFSWDQRASTPAPARSDGEHLTIGGAMEAVLPRLGFSLDADGHVPTEDEVALLRAVAPKHLRAEIDFAAPPKQLAAALDRCAEIVRRVGTEIDLACYFAPDTPDISGSLQGIAAKLADVRPARLALLPLDDTVTPPAWLDQAKAILVRDDSPSLIVGTRSDFVALNRQRPLRSFDGSLTYAASAEVHDSDEAAIMQSIEGHAATVATARAFAPAAQVHVAPISLKPWRRDNTAPADERQGALFAAAWLAASVSQLAHAGAHSLTYFECTGSRGILARRGGSSGDTPVPFPVFHVLGYLARHATMPLVSCIPSDPTRACAICFRTESGVDALLANLLPRRQSITISGLTASPYFCKLLTPRGFGDTTTVSGPAATLELGPYSVAALTPKR